MKDYSTAESVLKTMLGKLGFEVDLVTRDEASGPCINIISEDSSTIIGKNGDRLEDLQYLMNRIISRKDPSLPRIKVDCEDYRKQQELLLLEKVNSLADKVRADGKPARTRPLNAYYRRLVHNAFSEVDDIQTSSPEGVSRYKRIQISLVGGEV